MNNVFLILTKNNSAQGAILNGLLIYFYFFKDDIIDDVDSFLAAAETLKERGAYKIFVMATHGILSSDAPRLIEESAIDEVVIAAF